MRIALLIDTLTGGGSEGVVLRLASGLAERGNDVFVHCLKTPGIDCPSIAGLTIVAHDSGRRDFRLPLRLASRFSKDRIDVVHAHCCAGLCAAWPAAKCLGLPIIHVRHGWPLARPSRHAWLADQLAPTLDRIVVNSASGRDRLPKWVRTDAVHIPNGVAVAPVEAAEARAALEQLCRRSLRGPIVLSVANIRPEKDHITLLRAFARVRDRIPVATLVCVGGSTDDVYQRQVLAERDRLQLQSAALFVGPYEGAARLMPAADVFCLASCTESMPNAILEAMAQRVPIVATAVGDIGRIDGTNADHMLEHRRSALLAPASDVVALAAAVHQSLRDRTAAHDRAACAFERFSAEYSTHQMVERYERLYAECRARRSGGRSAVRRPAILMVGPAAPQIGGMVTSIDTLMHSPLATTFQLHRFASVRPRARAASSCGPGVRLIRRLISAVHAPFAAIRHLAALVSLAATLILRRIDIVHIHTCSFRTFYRTLADLGVARFLGRRTVLHIRGGRFAEFCAASTPLGRRVIRRGAESADRIIVLSEGTAAAVRPWLGTARIEVVANGVAVRSAITRSPAVAPEPCRFLFLGELSVAKGVVDLLDTAVRLRAIGTPFELVLAGPAHPSLSDLDAPLRDLGLAREVIMLGAVNRCRRDELLRSVDCLVHPSHSEAMPNTILEAAAAGLPVIATAVGAVPEILGARGTPTMGQVCFDALTPLVLPGDPRALAAAMHALAIDAPRRRQIGAALRAHVSAEYSDVRLAERLTAIYNDVLAGAAARFSKNDAPPLAHAEPKLHPQPAGVTQ